MRDHIFFLSPPRSLFPVIESVRVMQKLFLWNEIPRVQIRGVLRMSDECVFKGPPHGAQEKKKE